MDFPFFLATVENAPKGGKFNLGYDEDGVDNVPWALGSTCPTQRDIIEMIGKLKDDSFKVANRTPVDKNPYRWCDGCCYYKIKTKEKALEYWEQQLKKKAAIEEAQKNRKSDL